MLSAEDFLKHNRGTDFGGNTDWFKEVSRKFAFNQKNTLQLAGGNRQTNYIVSFDLRNAHGLDLRSDKKEYGARLNLSHTSANNLYTATVTIAPRSLKANNASYNAFNQSLTLNPTLPVMDAKIQMHSIISIPVFLVLIILLKSFARYWMEQRKVPGLECGV
ncbi:hypothetical protein KUH03_39655 [Sphingobacterium sp. E70]|uniref:hypothetical protein n=1 Tax=Sphingobacterium sp. E70 TaxID=2853439 RepID=UPI00211D0D00|nr:hypothetical protein [Sphingobacterium sp. E70]ULT24931.1 hypothetical protein KUH03_39655 [Sphingobacterium sp. E70]